RSYNDPRISVVEAEFVVVLGDEQRPSGIPATAYGEVFDRLREPAFDARDPVRHVVCVATVPTQHAEAVERLDRARGFACAGGVDDCACGVNGVFVYGREVGRGRDVDG